MSKKQAMVVGACALALLAVTGTIAGLEKKFDAECFDAGEFQTKYAEMVNAETPVASIVGQTAKNFAKVTSLPDKVAGKMHEFKVIQAKNDGVVGLLPVNQFGCALNKDGTQTAEKDSDGATFGAMPKFLFEKFLQQAEGGPAEDTGKGI